MGSSLLNCMRVFNLIYLVQPAANLAPIKSRKPPPNAAGIGTPFVVANVSDEIADKNPPNMAVIT